MKENNAISLNNKLMNFSKLYYKKLKYENKSTNTIVSYKNTINTFIAYILLENSILSLKEIKPSTLYAYLEYREFNMNKQGNMTENSKKVIITILKTFFNFIENESDELLSFQKLFEHMKIKSKKVPPKGLDEEKQKKLLNYLEEQKNNDQNNYVVFRNSLIVKMMLFAGLRVSEVLSLKYEDYICLKEDNLYRIQVTGKGDKTRIVFIGFDSVDDELQELSLYHKSKMDLVCLSKKDNLLRRQDLDKMLRSLCRQAGIKEIGCHTLRHSFAKNFLNKGGNITHLQKLLGHSSFETTIMYANPHEEDIKNGFVKQNNK